MSLPRTKALSALTGAVGDLVSRGTELYAETLTQSVRSWKYATWTSNRWMEGNIFPTMEALIGVQRDVGQKVTEVARGESSVRDALRGLGDRAWAAARWSRLVNTVGREVFGSARWDGEEVLAEDTIFRLTYIPPAAGVERSETAIFHSGGTIPYGDRIFRLTPEHNLFGRFVERGVGVYAMELKGDRFANDYGALTIEGLSETIDRLSDVAFTHHGRRLVMEGYCGHGTQALHFLCSRPGSVQRKFRALATFVSPVDGTRCERIASSVQRAPDGLMDVNYALWQRLGGFVPGDPARVGLDLALGAVFHKTQLGYLTAGWTNHEVGLAKSVRDLDASGRRNLAGAYWISPESARRFPIPVGIARYTTPLFVDGIAPDGTLPWKGPDGQALSLRTLAEQTDLRIFGFYGGQDVVVPDSTGHCLMSHFGDRYTHIVHPHAGHISYILSPGAWGPSHKRRLAPNPVDLLLADEPAVKTKD